MTRGLVTHVTLMRQQLKFDDKPFFNIRLDWRESVDWRVSREKKRNRRRGRRSTELPSKRNRKNLKTTQL